MDLSLIQVAINLIGIDEVTWMVPVSRGACHTGDPQKVTIVMLLDNMFLLAWLVSFLSVLSDRLQLSCARFAGTAM